MSGTRRARSDTNKTVIAQTGGASAARTVVWWRRAFTQERCDGDPWADTNPPLRRGRL